MWRRLVVLGVLSLGCEVDEASETAEDTAEEMDPPAPRTCVAPEGLGSPTSIQDAVDLINALPKPTSLPCFLESLDRPLAVAATDSRSSAQPSTGAENPRLFITRASLILSVLPEGPGSDKLEFAVDVGDGLSIKAELAFPIEEEIADSEPYAQIRRQTGTGCGACHLREQHWDTVGEAGVFASEALQHPPENDISPGFVGALAGVCDPELTPDRCAMLTAVFAHGSVVAQPLPETLKICRLVE